MRPEVPSLPSNLLDALRSLEAGCFGRYQFTLHFLVTNFCEADPNMKDFLGEKLVADVLFAFFSVSKQVSQLPGQDCHRLVLACHSIMIAHTF